MTQATHQHEDQSANSADVVRRQSLLRAIRDGASSLPREPAAITGRRVEPINSHLWDAAPRSPNDRHPQFSMLSLMAIVTLFSLFFAVMPLLGPLWSALSLWFAMLFAAHVAANAWGTHVARQNLPPGAPLDQATRRIHREISEAACAPSTGLRRAVHLGRTLQIAVGGAALVGAVLGCLAMLAIGIEQVGVGGVILGTCSLGIVAGFFGFLVSSFVQVAGRAFREAAHTTRG